MIYGKSNAGRNTKTSRVKAERRILQFLSVLFRNEIRNLRKGERFIMKRLFSLLLVLAMVFSMVCIPSFADDSPIKESASGFYYIEANGDQVALSAASAEKFIQVDGLYFKDLNGNGTLDVYEDWRQDVDARVADLLSQMTMDEKAGALLFACVAGQNGSTVTDFNADIAGFGGGGSDASVEASASTITLDHPALNAREPIVEYNGLTFQPTAYQIQDLYVNTFIAALTGTPKDQLDTFNLLQGYAEDTRLGIPATFSGDRSYNTWGGMIDMPHYALGVAHDPELLYNLVSEYAKESVAIGYHQTFHGYGNEIGSWYGDDPEYIALMTDAETRAYEENGFQSHTKHFIARGGRNSYVNAKSPADLLESWLIGWKAAIDAGTQYIMTNNNIGVTPGVQGYMDKDTYDILRNDLGYDGVVCLDWPLGDARLMTKTGILSDGTDISTLSLVERYALILNAGVDMFSCSGGVPGTDVNDEAYADLFMPARPAVIVQAVEEGLVTAEDLDVHVGRVLKTKFAYGLFENQYRDWEALLDLIGTDAYKAEQTIPLSTEEIDNYRRPEIIEMEEQVMVKSTILLKNDGILPLQKGIKVYFDSNNSNVLDETVPAFAEYATIVEDMAEADVCIFQITSYDDAYSYMVEDAQTAEKPFIVLVQSTNSSGEPTEADLLAANAFAQLTYVNTPDHGSSVGSFYRYVKPAIVMQMLFGEQEPGGTTLFEVAANAEDKTKSWGELQDDIGVTNATRLYMAMLAKENPEIDMPNNLGDVLYTDSYGILYSAPADIELSLLTTPQIVITEEYTNSWGSQATRQTAVNHAAAGEKFEINFVAKNNGGAGSLDAQILVDGEVAATKFIGVAEGQFRVISVYLTLEAGVHTISVGDLSTTITVE